MTTEDMLEEIRGTQAQEETLTRRWGAYRASEVDQYVGKLLDRLRNMEMVYKQQYEEMRTSLLGMTRERDEQQEKARSLERQLAEVPHNLEEYLLDQNLATIPKVEYERLQGMEAVYRKEIDRLTLSESNLMQEREQLVTELNALQLARQEAEDAARQIEQLKSQADVRAEEYRLMTLQRDQQHQQTAQRQAQLDAAARRIQEQGEALLEAGTQYRALELQRQLDQEMAQQILQEKERLQKELLRLQQRWEAERASMGQRYQEVLRSQQQCMQRLQENFTASMRCMESIGEAGMVAYPSKDEQDLVTE